MAMEVGAVVAVPFTNMVSLTMYIELEGRMIPHLKDLDEAERPNHF